MYFSGKLGVVLLGFPLFFLTRPAPESFGGDLGTDQSREEFPAQGSDFHTGLKMTQYHGSKYFLGNFFRGG